MRILIVGAGAVGGYFGARLAAAGRDVTFLVRAGRAEQLRRTGLIVKSPQGDLSIQPKLLLAAEIVEPFDLIVLSTKAYSLDAAIQDFAPAVSPQTMILPLLNGMRHFDILVARFGESAVLGGSTRIVSDLSPEGHVLQFGPWHDMVFGERDKSVTPGIEALGATLQGCGFPTMLSPDILAALWMKWTMLSSLAGTTCLLRGTIGEIEAATGGVETVRAIIAESAAISAANGYPQKPDFLEQHTARMTEPGSALTASMFRDLQKGAPVEADHILGDFLARGRAHGVAAPLLEAAYVQLSIYSASLSQK
ncbi:ketopantoate reductase family protein [Granulicella mallensis]|uniref:2-dehydropantoate 2-reductase n=1 Tax=Granulicella mallensis (strain ATCC BAA-1857 / DSM 23137 / MP5ACTX8) TaxID=682795 RepID=G8NNN5_GRAMM|nr:ketopantoate reductase family protein [Granulicella mallensis]AEU34820.1 2-dehydropantoate 2-reductase [Granulicella mallensis MP5ACTX8]